MDLEMEMEEAAEGEEVEVVGRHLARLGEADSEGRRAAMHSLKAFVEQLDSGSMPAFLQQVSPSRGAGSGTGSPQSKSFAISLYEEVARAHGKLIVPHIGRVMATVTRSIASGSSSSSSPQLHQACARVVASIARHAIDPAGPPADAQAVLRALSQPLLDCVVSDSEPLAAGAALCLQALVESEKWKHAGSEMAQELCSRVCAGVREKGARGLGVAHLQLARSLVLASGSAVKGFCAPLLRSATQMLMHAGGDGAQWQSRVCAARLLQALLEAVDRRALPDEDISAAVRALELCGHDRSPHVRGAATEALHSASGHRDGGRRLQFRRNSVHLTGESATSSLGDPRGSSSRSLGSGSGRGRLGRDGRGRDWSGAYSSNNSWRKVAHVDDGFSGGEEEEEEEEADERASHEGRRVSDASEGSPMRLSVDLDARDEDEGAAEESASPLTVQGRVRKPPSSAPTTCGTTITFQSPERQEQVAQLRSEDACVVPFTTPRRLLHSLVSDDEPGNTARDTGSEASGLDMETCSNNSWSVHDNPIASAAAPGRGDERVKSEQISNPSISLPADRSSRFGHGGPTLESEPQPAHVISRSSSIRQDGFSARGVPVPEPIVLNGRSDRQDGGASGVDDTWQPAQSDRAVEFSVLRRKSMQLARGLVEMIMGGSLCAIVALPVAFAISRIVESESYTPHMLVPT